MHSKLVLFFTKMDIFLRNISKETSLFGDYFKDYSGPPTDAIAKRDFITAKFTNSLLYPRELDIYYMDVTNTGTVRSALASILGGAPISPPDFTFTKHATLKAGQRSPPSKGPGMDWILTEKGWKEPQEGNWIFGQRVQIRKAQKEHPRRDLRRSAALMVGHR